MVDSYGSFHIPMFEDHSPWSDQTSEEDNCKDNGKDCFRIPLFEECSADQSGPGEIEDEDTHHAAGSDVEGSEENVVSTRRHRVEVRDSTRKWAV